MYKELTEEQVHSACLSYRHDYGLMTPVAQAALRSDCIHWNEALSKLTPEPSADVVEMVDAMLRPFCHDGDRPLAVSAVQSIIEAEVERRVSNYRNALDKARKYIEDGSPLPPISDPYWSTIKSIDEALDEALAKGTNKRASDDRTPV